jgi:hypothetical protein
VLTTYVSMSERLPTRLSRQSSDSLDLCLGNPEVISSSVGLVPTDALVMTGLANFRVVGSNRQPMTLSARYAASRISSNLKGSTKQFGWLRALEPILFRPYDQRSSWQTDSWRSCPPRKLRIHSLRTAFMKSSTFRFMHALLTLRCCSMLMPVKKVKIISASIVGFISGFSASIFLTIRSLRKA